MSQIIIKRSAVPAKVPATTDLALGELGVNTYDGKLYLKKNNGSDAIVEVGVAFNGGTITNALTIDAAVTQLILGSATNTSTKITTTTDGSGNGNQLTLTPAAGGNTNGQGGHLSLNSGAGIGSGTGGSVTITCGNAGTSGSGSNMSLRPGNAGSTGATTGGTLQLNSGNSASATGTGGAITFSLGQGSNGSVERFRISTTGAFVLGGTLTNYGIAGQVLTSAGNATPTWSTPSSTSFASQLFTATAGQTSFTIPGGYAAGLIEVFANGYKLNSTDYTASNGTTVVLNTGLSAADELEVVVYSGLSLATLAGGSITGTLSVQTLYKKVSPIAAAPTSTQNIDLNTASIWNFTVAATANFTLNIRGSASASLDSTMTVSQAAVVNVLVLNGGTAFYPTAYTIDGVAVTPKWQGTAPVAGDANAIDSYRLTIIKTGTAAFTVLASVVKFA
jgi:hypothetical protein